LGVGDPLLKKKLKRKKMPLVGNEAETTRVYSLETRALPTIILAPDQEFESKTQASQRNLSIKGLILK